MDGLPRAVQHEDNGELDDVGHIRLFAKCRSTLRVRSGVRSFGKIVTPIKDCVYFPAPDNLTRMKRSPSLIE